MNTERSSAGNQAETDTHQDGVTPAPDAVENQGGVDDGNANDEAPAQGLDADAPSSSAQDETEATLADVIRNAVTTPEKESDPASSDRKDGKAGDSEGEDNPEAKSEQTGEDEGDSKPEDDSKLPFHKHPRWKEVLRERDQYRAGHEQFEQIQTFMQVNGLSAEEVAEGFEVMAMMRRDPEKALEKITAYAESLELATGRKLPDDLAKRVDDGLVDEDTARETARLRLEAQQRRQQAEAYAAQNAQATQQTAIQSIQQAASQVEREIQSSDPDYTRKQPFVMDRVRALIVEKQPRTPEEAAAIVRQAHAEITDRLKPMIRRNPVTTVTSGDATANARPAPKSLFEVVQQAAAKTR